MQKEGNEKRYKHKFTYWLPAVVYVLLVGLWLFCPILPISPMTIFIAVLMGGFVMREIYWYFKDWGKDTK